MSSIHIPWKQRENALLLATPLVLIPGFAFLPTVAFLIVMPVSEHSPALGYLLLFVYALCEYVGVRKLASCIELEMDVISFFAWGIIMVLLVITACVGVLMVGLVFRG